MVAASSMSRGIERKNPISIHTENGSANDEYARISAQYVFSSPRSDMSWKYGMISSVSGSILVNSRNSTNGMAPRGKKRVTPYAASAANMTESTVEPSATTRLFRK